MKKVVFIFAVMLFSTNTFAQGIFDKLEDLDDVSTVVVTKDAFELLSKFPDAKSEGMEFFNVLKGLQELKVFSTEKTTIASNMEKMANSAIKKGNLTQLMRIKDKGSRVKIYVKATKNKDIVSEVLMFVKDTDSKDGNPSSTIISLVGNINVNELAKIANDYEKKK